MIASDQPSQHVLYRGRRAVGQEDVARERLVAVPRGDELSHVVAELADPLRICVRARPRRPDGGSHLARALDDVRRKGR